MLREFEGLITIVKDKMEFELSSSENKLIIHSFFISFCNRAAYSALTEFEKKYLWTMNEKLKKKRMKEEERRMKKRNAMERIKKTIHGVELMLASLKKMQFSK